MDYLIEPLDGDESDERDWLTCSTCLTLREAWILNPDGTVTCDACEVN